jgi:hypothetical protein
MLSSWPRGTGDKRPERPLARLGIRGIGGAGGGDEDRAAFDEALRLNPNAFDVLTHYACWAHLFDRAEAGAQAVDRAMRLNPNFPSRAIPCFRLGLTKVGRYEDAVRIQARQPEDTWNMDGYVITAGS